MKSLTLPTHANAALIEAAYQSWLENPDSVDPTWRAFFQGFALGSGGQLPINAADIGQNAAAAGVTILDSAKQEKVLRLINAHRAHGHLQAHLDPLGDPPRSTPLLNPGHFGLTEDEMGETFNVGTYKNGGQMRLRELIESLRRTYCGHIGVEYMHVQDTGAREWLQQKMESVENQPSFLREQKIRILRRLHKAELFERFLHTKYVGQKRFGLEGGETFIAALDTLVEHCPAAGVEEIVMGMAHRGRLNVLTSVMRKPFELIFEQFSENYLPDTVAGDGDVKYHLGYEAMLETADGHRVEMRLAANPSHLEAVDPVVEGKARARQRIRNDAERIKVLPFLVHGDAAFAGQGVVAETFNFSQLPGYRTGGTVHFIVNNQIGFTTLPREARSTRYCTDVAKMIEAPIFHVNGDDAEAVCMMARLALEFRVKFHRDVVIDMVCYRKHGHNESDEPAFTQPALYRKISSHPPVTSFYTLQLVTEGSITEQEGEAIRAEYNAALEANLAKARESEAKKSAKRAAMEADPHAVFRGSTAIFQPAYSFSPVTTGIGADAIERIVRGLASLPAGFKPNPKIRRFLDTRIQAHKEGGPVDWAFGEALAFGSLLIEGTPVRLSGQDCERGTFSQRHAVLYDADTNESYTPLNHLGEDQARFCVYNSVLSEAAVLGFDYGYSLDYPHMLCMWEAQFGDFANGAQVIIDQFICCAESKWQRASGMVLLLPHGYEGQGPEHSSARLERFLQLCAEDNLQVANITTPANFFHALRRQMRRDFRKPLVVMSPKSLLRHPAAVSKLDEFASGHFQNIIDDPAWSPEAAAGNPKPESPASKPSRLVLCSGKVCYDLVESRIRNKIDDTAIVRVEQLYPLDRNRLLQIADNYSGARLVWCQEESQNMGAWPFIAPQLEEIFGRKPAYAGRDAAASPAVGTLALHRLELTMLLKDAFTL
ncbi:MAG: 2-oxoglutarate dehydrogenase E1 component [Opitutaceae bacterium]|jgi:2-oxoglutarate dehydrogenase E1 component